MPTLFLYKGYRIMINTRDHNPPHVHIVGHGCSVVIDIVSFEARNNVGLEEREINFFKAFIAMNQEALLKKWRIIHEKK